MKRNRGFNLGFIALSFVLLLGVGRQVDGSDYVEGQLVIRLTEGTPIGPVNAEFGTTVLVSIPDLNVFLLQLPPHVSEQALLQLLEVQNNVEWVELNFIGDVADGQTQSFFVSMSPPDYDDQYAWSIVDLPGAHAAATGQGAVVAVLDTGVDATHEVLMGRVLAGGYNFIAMDENTADTGNGLDDDGDGVVDEMVGHGTFLAGIIAKTAPAADILAVKVLNGDGLGDTFTVAQGIFFAIEAGADVINLSLVVSEETQILSLAASEALEAGVVVAAAAGNADQTEPLPYPAADPVVIAVGATDAGDLKALFSNYGEFVAVCAPGVDIVSCFPGNQYALSHGTSMSAAFVSGVAALLRSIEYADPLEVQFTMAASADPLDVLNPGYGGLLGAGRLNAAGAVAGEVGKQPSLWSLQIRRRRF